MTLNSRDIVELVPKVNVSYKTEVFEVVWPIFPHAGSGSIQIMADNLKKVLLRLILWYNFMKCFIQFLFHYLWAKKREKKIYEHSLKFKCCFD